MSGVKPQARRLGQRLDYLTFCYRVAHEKRQLQMLKLRAVEARKQDTPVPVELDGEVFKLHPPQRDGKWLLQNAAVRMTILEKGPGGDGDAPGWNTTVECSGTSLLSLGPVGAAVYAEKLAKAMGEVVEKRFGRVDAMGDIANYDLRADDLHSFVKQRRVKIEPHMHDGTAVVRRKRDVSTSGETVEAERVRWRLDGRKVVSFLRDADDGIEASYYAGGTFTGFTFGSRRSVTVRVYDKRHELRSQNPDKREAEEAWWREGGWDGKAPVTRVEAEFRGEALDELRLRFVVPGDVSPECHIEKLLLALDGAWQYATTKWLRLVRRGQPDVVQPRWREVQEAVFVRSAAPRERVRQRHACKAAQAQGACVSLVAAMGQMPIRWPVWYDLESGVVTDEIRASADADALVEEHCRASKYDPDTACELELVRGAKEIGERAMLLVVDYEKERAGGDAKQALARMWARQRAAMARFYFPRRCAVASAPVPLAQAG